MNNKQKSYQCREAIRTQSKRINLWRKLGIGWKSICNKLELQCSHSTLSANYHSRGLL